MKIFKDIPHYYIDIPMVFRQDKPKVKFGYRNCEAGLWEFMLRLFVVPRVYLSV